MVFYGEYTVSVTEGGRMVIPKRIRENLKGDTCILTKGFDTCLAGYDKNDWERRASELLSVSLLEKEHIEKKRLVFSGAHYVGIDEQGRFVIPKGLLEFVGISEKMVIIGVGDRFEIWSLSRWREYSEEMKL